MNIERVGIGFAGIGLLATALGVQPASASWLLAMAFIGLHFIDTSFISVGSTAKLHAATSAALGSTFSDSN